MGVFLEIGVKPRGPQLHHNIPVTVPATVTLKKKAKCHTPCPEDGIPPPTHTLKRI